MSRPNIILINCDDMGYGDLSCYGSAVNHTPAIDRMAAEGVRCTSWYSPSPVCSPSRGATLTGCYPPRIGFGSFTGWSVLFPGHSVGLHPDEPTFADYLRGAGYRTCLIGKWHCGDQEPFLPLNHGFDEFYGLPYSNDMGRQKGHPPVSAIGNPYPPLPLMSDDEIVQFQPDQRSLTERYTERAVGFIKENRDRPFLLYFNHYHVHLPHYAPDHLIARSENGVFGACMASVDWSVAVLRRTLEELGLSENTLIVFTSDNGSRADHGASNGPLRGQKTTTWEGGQRVPCIWYWKNHTPEGTVCDEVMSHTDFFSTLLALAGTEADDALLRDSHDVTGVILRGIRRTEEENLFYYYWMNSLEAIRLGKWKLHLAKHNALRNFVEVHELYDLEADSGESINLYAEHPDIVAAFAPYIERIRRDLGDERLNITGEGVRPCGTVDHPRLLSQYDKTYPYLIAEYDSTESG